MKTLAVLGSTGSIGTNTLDVVRRNRGDYRVFALAAGQNTDLLAAQIVEFRPDVAVVADSGRLPALVAALDAAGVPPSERPELLYGCSRTPGNCGRSRSRYPGFRNCGGGRPGSDVRSCPLGKKGVGLANKEVLVSAGKLVMEAVARHNALLVPIDSEHNGAHQCLRAGNREAVSRLILTASGGPFRNTPASELAFVTPEQALNHPTWKMGSRITIDSATLMNKGFEVIEACWLFGFAPSEVDVVVHPQSKVHAMIEYSDGSVLANISATDMRMPIQYALTYPERSSAPVPRIDWAEARQWEFMAPDFEKFPLLRLAYRCQEAGGSATCVLNAADEVAVEAFLDGKIGFLSIYEVVRDTLDRMPARTPHSIGEVLEIDGEARIAARGLVSACASAAGV